MSSHSFPVPSCVLFASRHDKVTEAPLPNHVRAFEGILPKRDADEAEADAKLTESGSALAGGGLPNDGVAISQCV